MESLPLIDDIINVDSLLLTEDIVSAVEAFSHALDEANKLETVQRQKRSALMMKMIE